MDSTTIKEKDNIDNATLPVQDKELKSENTQETSLEKQNSKNKSYEWMLGVTPKEEEVEDEEEEDAEDENSLNNQVVKSFTGYTLQFKTWKKK